ncbi:MAG: hypothetical protein IJR73_03290 [Bacteroidales bacterium]|nr:hypothetical protein [Bacteroidales bacterium]
MRRLLTIFVVAFLTASCAQTAALKHTIAEDKLMAQVDSMAKALAATGFNAGSVYKEIWIRDFNTFIELSLEVMPRAEVREVLDTFIDFQAEDGNIPDAFVEVATADNLGYKYRFCEARPGMAAHKNTVETDQESSFVQAVAQYVAITGDYDYLKEVRAGKTVLEHLEDAMSYLRHEKWNDTYGLITGATTADWGDVQPEHGWGVEIDHNTHYTIDIYDNAMFALALDRLCELEGGSDSAHRWLKLRDTLRQNIRTHLWDSRHQKFRPHIYLNGSPFPADFNEDEIYYHGGTAVAALAGILTKKEVAQANRRMLANMKSAGAQSIGLTLFPAYPDGFFANPMMGAYQYQNGGDWTWFGARWIEVLVRYGMIREAYDELKPMLQRTVDGGFYEWYHLDGTPVGSGTYRGTAGVLYRAIKVLRRPSYYELKRIG